MADLTDFDRQATSQRPLRVDQILQQLQHTHPDRAEALTEALTTPTYLDEQIARTVRNTWGISLSANAVKRWRSRNADS